MAANPQSTRSRDGVTGAEVLTGEMLVWSDLGWIAAPLAVEVVVADIVRSRSPQRVLLAGPRAATLVKTLPESARVEILLRSIPDSRVASDAAGLHDRASLHIGGLDAYSDDKGFDLVVGLGGPTRLLGPDSTGMGETDVLSKLSALVADGGTLVADVGNELGLHELLAAQPLLDIDSNDAWHVGADGFNHRRLHLAELEAWRQDQGLTTDVLFGAYPSPDQHHLLIDGAALSAGHPDLLGAARVRSCRAVERHFQDFPVLRDPRSTVERLVDGGLVTQLAPSWLLVAHRGDVASDLTLPAVIDAETWVDPAWARVDTVDHAGGSTAVWASGNPDAEVNIGSITRDLSLQSVANGRLLEMELRDACARRSHRDIRALIRQYNSWLHDSSVWSSAMAERRSFATIDNVVIGGDAGLGIMDGSWRRAGVVAADDMLVLALRQFATRLLASAASHPWKTSTTPDDLTASLAAMVGVVVTEDVVRRVVRVQSEIASVIAPGDLTVAEMVEADLEQGELPRNLPSATATGFRELLALDRARSRRMREHDGQVAWLEGTLRHRDRYIRDLERIIERYEDTLTWKTVQAMRAPRRIATDKAVATAKSTANQVLPPDFMSKARRLARRAVK
ncbi:MULTISPECIES: hypothetical protein [unclassified Knoellia]|uniref:hypothetical protein n=1 Tax=Knoellia altitudinis TaxID=3404795 RepID=UPI003609F6FE